MTRRSGMTIAWRRLDRPGHETGRVERVDDGWRLSGAVVLTYEGFPCRIDYVVDCDAGWGTRRCEVRGFFDDAAIALDVSRDSDAIWRAGQWREPQVDGCDDIDLGFTPMTNLIPIRRLALDVGASAEVRAAWLSFPELRLDRLEQTYTRISPTRYLYESAGGAFRRELTVDSTGVVVHYPGLWIAESRPTSPNP